ncbi:hypothetical a-type peptide pheromone precursor, partial [Postia placenta Mad-698-R]
MDAFLTLAEPVPSDETDISRVPSDYEWQTNTTNFSCTIA